VEGLHSFAASDCDDRGTDNSSSVHFDNMVLGYSKHYHVHNMGRWFVLRLQVCRSENKVKCCSILEGEEVSLLQKTLRHIFICRNHI